MNSKNIFIGIILVFAIGVLSYAGFFSDITGKQISHGCFDSDSNPSLAEQSKIKGYITVDGSSKREFFNDEDFCSLDYKDNGKWVIEYTCDPYIASGYKRNRVFCENGCRAGACL